MLFAVIGLIEEQLPCSEFYFLEREAFILQLREEFAMRNNSEYNLIKV